ncbi:MAG: RNA polymerase sigma-70 factor (ECF subfamily) [Myxococcota bacterium]|jgi:RNA polymerase sigma-70 factor (ECF subfamily)
MEFRLKVAKLRASSVEMSLVEPRSPDSQSPSADEALQRAKRASELNFRTLYRDYRSKVYGTVHHVVGGSDEIDDIVQTVFLEVHRSLPRYKGQSKLSTWIYRISVNVALQYIRKRKRRRVFLFFKEDDYRMETFSHELSDRYENRELLVKLYSLMDKLSEKKRIVFTLHELEGLPVEEIAEVCEIPVNTVRSRLHAARTELMRRMQKAGMMENGL